MTTKVMIEADELLGPVDLGPPQRWTHKARQEYEPLADWQRGIALCGTPGVRYPADKNPGYPLCPDCVRLHGGPF